MSSAICFNLDQSKSLLPGNGLTTFSLLSAKFFQLQLAKIFWSGQELKRKTNSYFNASMKNFLAASLCRNVVSMTLTISVL